ncbi:MAG: hypothetical protein KBS76_07015, partial [Ruminococcus sp.]|nr:hypothetical protein [Candidatus Apopatosoma intestinale]
LLFYHGEKRKSRYFLLFSEGIFADRFLCPYSYGFRGEFMHGLTKKSTAHIMIAGGRVSCRILTHGFPADPD